MKPLSDLTKIPWLNLSYASILIWAQPLLFIIHTFLVGKLFQTQIYFSFIEPVLHAVFFAYIWLVCWKILQKHAEFPDLNRFFLICSGIMAGSWLLLLIGSQTFLSNEFIILLSLIHI